MDRGRAFRTITQHIYKVIPLKFGKPSYIVLADSYNEAKQVVADEFNTSPDDYIAIKISGTGNPQIYTV